MYMQGTFRRGWSLLAAALSLSVAPAARGQSVADKEQAKALVVEGRELRDGKQDHRGALERFRAAYRLIKTPIIGLDLAGEHAWLRELVEAYGVCDEIGRLPPRDAESDQSKDARTKAAELGVALKARLPKLALRVKDERAGGAPPRVVLDGVALAPEALLVPREVNPGPHTLVVEVPGAAPTRTTVTAAEGTTQRVALEVPGAAAALPGDGAAGPALRATGWVAAGTGLAAFGLGGALGLSAKSQADGAHCDARNACATPADVARRHDAVVQAGAATVLVVVGAALAAGGVVVWLVAPRGQPGAPVPVRSGALRAGVSPAGLVLEGRF